MVALLSQSHSTWVTLELATTSGGTCGHKHKMLALLRLGRFAPSELAAAIRRKQGNNKYLSFATYKGYDISKKPDEQYELYDPWEKSEYDFYAQVIEFYEQDKSREVDSESDAEDG